MARGSRGHRRRSPGGVLPFTDPSFLNPHLSFPITQHFKHLRGQKTYVPGKHTKEPGRKTYTELTTLGVRCRKAAEAVAVPASAEQCSSIVPVLCPLFRLSEECKLLPHLGNQLAFFVDKEK